ncbi:hydroxypyruvate isomerase family protein [Arthrobacter psychrochitiniphilus]|uniref:Hydroxypyruvate isomerase n=1 Tax=Arthrobacter psychrochitiniphilus TaxID=291045 RepID=A0A2V3DN83_9MICC|nr:TIM barrel protein [Arthrobacter psychrochitiniphilus]NYG16210.1 hydroxypyruvate isomerase [Arthrobacter psychrochitiniphilus]PXA64415.1 hydroxypyruvate isomerase [Arthrobacter psychrochitiniphilus]
MTYTVNCSILLTELPLLERPAAAKAAGFDAVEFWWPFESNVPGDAELTAFERAITDAGVQLTGLNFNAGNMPGGDRGLVSWKGRCSEFKDNVDAVVGIGERLGTKAFNALYGNRQDDYTPAEQDELAVKNLVYAAQGVAKIGGTVLLEPVSGTPAYPLKTAADVLAVIAKTQEAGVDNVKLLADFYHLAVNGDDVPAVIENHAKDFGHIQIADDPGRGAPGTGTLPLGEWITRSRELGYAGPIGLEYKSAAADAFSWTIRQQAN